MESNSANKLNVEMNHVPLERLIADFDRFTDKAPGRIFDNRKSLGENLLKILPPQFRKAFLDATERLFGVLY